MSFIAIGFTIGGGVFVFTGIVLKIVGPALPLAYALAVIPVILSMLPLAMLGSALPATGGSYKYPSRMVSPGFTFVGLWVYILATFFGQIPLYSLACAGYLRVIFPGMPTQASSIGIITLFYLANVLGLRVAAQVQGVMVIVMLGALLFFSGNGLMHFHPQYLDGFFQKGSGSLALGVALLTFTYLGSNSVIELGGEIVDPGRVIPRALFIAFAVVSVVYLLIALAVVGALPWQSLASSDEPLIAAARSYLSVPGVVFFVVGGAVLALTTTLNALFIVGTKSLLVMINDGLLPRFLGRIHPRFRTAHVLLTIVWGVSVIGVLSGFSLETFASYAALGAMIIFLPLLMASVKLPALYPAEYGRASFKLTGFWLWFCPAVGGLMILGSSAVILVDLRSVPKVAFFLLFLVSGVLYYQGRRHHLLAQGVDLRELKHRHDWLE